MHGKAEKESFRLLVKREVKRAVESRAQNEVPEKVRQKRRETGTSATSLCPRAAP